ncbi:hypothetical protein PCC9214_00407 [Planktothrix tepida]|uniref:Uncharacterized protein n=1 Tax=Planktothrix tepida PCC 9214 TaxID=671072 RepID=A0A1J1LEU2_9CYAN|nr:hypothetical protein [Planktothrix tepida]CAD5917005.1 hypothetical protein PCC9214_00407 [Planktothrix tepida]CUR30702.1 exported hypothetical protein [Planktothrix tepida PCC 9214]
MKIKHSLSLLGFILSSVIVPPLVHAQPIIPANDGTGTQIIPNNNQLLVVECKQHKYEAFVQLIETCYI